MSYICRLCGGPILPGQPSHLVPHSTGAQHDGCPYGPMLPDGRAIPDQKRTQTAQDECFIQIGAWVPSGRVQEVVEAVVKARSKP